MGQKIILLGEEYSDVEGVALPLVGGGEVVFPDVAGVTAAASDVVSGKIFAASNGLLIPGTRVYSPYGDDATLIATYDMGSKKLSETSFATWTPSTTAATIKATANLGTLSLDTDNYEYLTKAILESNTVYASGTTRKAAVVRQILEIVQAIYRRPSNLTNLNSGTDNYNYCTTLYTAPLMDYYNASGTHTLTFTGGYGIYGAAAAHTFSSSTSKTPTLTVKEPTYNARCSTSYFATGMASAVDKDNSTIKCKVYVYRIKRGALMYSMYHDLVEQYRA